MIHYSCDFCGTPIGPEDLRFEVKIEVRIAGGSDREEDEDEELEEILENEDGDPEALGENVYRLFRYDLCTHCHEAYLSDPLSRTRRLGLRNTEN